jgi:hypothetical protein
LPSLMCTRLYFLLVSRFLSFCLCMKLFSRLTEASSGCCEKGFNPWWIFHQLKIRKNWIF